MGATRELEYITSPDLPAFPDDYVMPEERHVDVFDFLQYAFGFQVCLSHSGRSICRGSFLLVLCTRWLTYGVQIDHFDVQFQDYIVTLEFSLCL